MIGFRFAWCSSVGHLDYLSKIYLTVSYCFGINIPQIIFGEKIKDNHLVAVVRSCHLHFQKTTVRALRIKTTRNGGSKKSRIIDLKNTN